MTKTENIGNAVNQTISDAPLPILVEKLGLAIAQAQSALDQNTVATAQQLANTQVTIGAKTYNMLALGFTPSFYSFTEANIEAKVAYSMQKEVDFSAKGSVKANWAVVAASVEASYSQKFSMSAEGSSSVQARLVAVPPPDIFMEILREEYQLDKESEPAEGDPEAGGNNEVNEGE